MHKVVMQLSPDIVALHGNLWWVGGSIEHVAEGEMGTWDIFQPIFGILSGQIFACVRYSAWLMGSADVLTILPATLQRILVS